MTKQQRKAAIALAIKKVESIKQILEMAEQWWDEIGADVEHPVYNNDLYDMLHAAEADLKLMQSGNLSGWEQRLMMENID